MFLEMPFDKAGYELNLAEGPGHGPPLLMLHGVGRSWTDFAPLFPALNCHWQLFCLDFRGHGKSARRPWAYRVTDYLEDVQALLPTTDDEVVIYGHSLGALVAAAAAAAMPDRVRAVILEDPPAASLLQNIRQSPYFALFRGMQVLAGDSASISDLAKQLAVMPLPGPGGGTIRLGDTRDAASLRYTARCLKLVDPDVYEPLLTGRWLDGYDVEAIMRGVKCPALILRGDESKGGMLNRAEAEQWANWMADATLIDIPGVGHLLHWLATETVARLSLSFLESLR
jgi:pimeloyl-ACP methyl ester carboxylesterase